MTTAEDTLSPIVVVSDDDDRMVRALCAALTRAGSWAIPDLFSKAPELSKRVRASLVILDLSQSRSGLELLKDLKADPDSRDIPVIVLTGSVEAGLKEKCLELGAEAFVEKPFSLAFVIDVAQKAAEAARERTRLAALKNS